VLWTRTANLARNKQESRKTRLYVRVSSKRVVHSVTKAAVHTLTSVAAGWRGHRSWHFLTVTHHSRDGGQDADLCMNSTLLGDKIDCKSRPSGGALRAHGAAVFGPPGCHAK